MTDLATAFTGSIPAIYDECLGPLFFEFSATDLAERVAKGIGGSGQLLEIDGLQSIEAVASSIGDALQLEIEEVGA